MPMMDSKNTYILNEISKILKKSDCQSILTLKLTKRRMIFFQSLEMPTRGDMFIHVHRNNFSPLTFWPILQTNVRPLAPQMLLFSLQTPGLWEKELLGIQVWRYKLKLYLLLEGWIETHYIQNNSVICQSLLLQQKADMMWFAPCRLHRRSNTCSIHETKFSQKSLVFLFNPFRVTPGYRMLCKAERWAGWWQWHLRLNAYIIEITSTGI